MFFLIYFSIHYDDQRQPSTNWKPLFLPQFRTSLSWNEGVILPNISIDDEVTQLLTKHSRLYCQFFLLITETVLERSFLPWAVFLVALLIPKIPFNSSTFDLSFRKYWLYEHLVTYLYSYLIYLNFGNSYQINFFRCSCKSFNPFHAIDFFWYPPENIRKPEVF